MIAPIMWSLLQALSKGAVQAQWQPLTLQGAGLFHVAMGAVLGIAAYGRTQEKLNGANNGGIQTPTTGSSIGVTAPSTPAAGGFSNSSFSSTPTSSGFGSTAEATTGINSSAGFGTSAAPTVSGFSSGFNNSTPSAQVLTGFGGKKAPVPAEDPLI